MQRHLVAGVILALTVSLAACGGGSSSGGGVTPGPDTTAPTLMASPASGPIPAAGMLTLTATDNADPAPKIYYTTDLSAPTDASTEYAGPIAIGNNTVVKCFAKDASGNESAVQVLGYVVAPPGSIFEQWANSGHGMIAHEAWRHWDEDVPQEVSASCAKCHAAEGFHDYAMDGSVDAPAPIQYGLACSGCHPSGPPATAYDDLLTYPELEFVTFPSGAQASLFGPSNMCMTCHQGRESGVSVQTRVDTTPPPYTFINIHYFPAAATLFGGEVNGGYEYPGMSYQGRNVFPSHPQDLKTCVGCHMQNAEGGLKHTWKPDVNVCSSCHGGTTFETLGGSPGANHTAIQDLLTALYAQIQTYASGTLGMPIFYDAHAYPYFFNDNGMGANFGNRYTSFDAKLLKAAYNYQVGQKDPCGYVHNGTYVQQLLYDSIVDLGGSTAAGLIPPGRMGFAESRTGPSAKTREWQLSGHADTYGEPFHHWDTDPNVSTSCAKCHSTPGFVDYAADGTVNSAAMQGSLVECYACHQSLNLYTNDGTRHGDLGTNPALEPITFPSGATATLNGSSNICMACHQGRSSGVAVENRIATTMPPYNFLNIHYYAAAASFFGSDVTSGVQYRSAGSYRGKNPFTAHGSLSAPQNCVACHLRGMEDHTFLPKTSDCLPCHAGATFETLSGSPGANHAAIQSLLSALLTAIQNYASTTIGTPIVYDPDTYPYWLLVGGGSYNAMDARLLRACYNYQFGLKEPCGYIHNGVYMRQILYDALDDLDDGLQNNSVVGQIRP